MIWQVAQSTGWSVEYIMWNLNYETLVLMLADAPRYVNEGKKKPEWKKRKKPKGKSTAQEILECFQTRLKK